MNSKVKSSQENGSNRTKRRSLSSIQPISTDNKVMTRSMATNKRSDKDKVKDKNERITKWLTQKDSIDFDLKYWKTLAKEREKALDITLKENKQMSEHLEEVKHSNQLLTKDNQQLNEDNRKLKEQLDEVEHNCELLTKENQHLSQLAEELSKFKLMIEECIE